MGVGVENGMAVSMNRYQSGSSGQVMESYHYALSEASAMAMDPAMYWDQATGRPKDTSAVNSARTVYDCDG